MRRPVDLTTRCFLRNRPSGRAPEGPAAVSRARPCGDPGTARLRACRRPIVLAAALALLGLGAGAAGAEPRYDAYRDGIFLRFLNAPEPGEPRRAPPTLDLSFGGETRRAVMDTGSTGIVVSADAIPGIDGLRRLGPGTLTYSSSGRIMRGDWVVTPVTVTGADGARVTTQPLPVLAVTRIDCFDTARDCVPEDAPRRVAMMGVGFARESDHQGQSTPDKNPFLNLPGMGVPGQPGPVRRGYVVTRDGVHVGLTAANTRGDYRFVALDKAADGRDWAPLPACIALDDLTPSCGSALLDTGVSVMYLTLPPERLAGTATDGRSLAPGSRLSIGFGADPSGAALRYGFTVGATAQAAAPGRIVLVEGATRPTFVNTGVHVLNVFDYLFDADAGYVGLRRIDR